jgi:hypothetical protein
MATMKKSKADVRRQLREDASDLEMFEKRRHEPNLDFEDVVKRLGLSPAPRKLVPNPPKS